MKTSWIEIVESVGAEFCFVLWLLSLSYETTKISNELQKRPKDNI